MIGTTVSTGTTYVSTYGASLEYWGVQPTLPPGVPPSLLNASYYVSVSQGTGAPKLTPMGSAVPYAFRSTDGTSLQVDWSPPWLLNNPNNANPATPPNVAYTAYLFGANFGAGPAAGALPIPTYGLAAYNLEDPCGATAANAACPGGCAKTATPESGTTRVTFTGLDPTQAFMVAVVATCNAYWCMPSGPGGVALQSQSFAYNPVPVPPGGPAGPSGTPTVGPDPGPGGQPGGTNTGALVGGLLGSLALLGAAGAGFVWYRRRGGGGGGGGGLGGVGSAAASGAEQVVSNLLASVRSLSPAKAPVAFSSSDMMMPVDGGNTNEQGLLGAEYAQMGDA